MKKLLYMTLPVVCAGAYMAQAQMEPPPGALPPPGYAPPQPMYAPPPVAAAQPYCQPYSDSFTMGGQKRITRGMACLHPDGSWELHPSQASVNYVMRGGAVYLVPAEPFVVVTDGHRRHPHFDR